MPTPVSTTKNIFRNNYWIALVRASIHELTVFWSENNKTDSCLHVICKQQS